MVATYIYTQKYISTDLFRREIKSVSMSRGFSADRPRGRLDHRLRNQSEIIYFAAWLPSLHNVYNVAAIFCRKNCWKHD